jgi:hypothetical protein
VAGSVSLEITTVNEKYVAFGRRESLRSSDVPAGARSL